MNESDDFGYVQRRLCAVMAKSEWTSSRMRMQKSGEELRERRTKSHQTANKFLQELLEKRTDSDLIDDNGAVDRYHKFVKYKAALNGDTNSTLDEFDRRLRALNNNQNRKKKLNNENISTVEEKQHQRIISNLQPTIQLHNNKRDINIQQIYHEDRAKVLPSIPIIPVTSTPNDTANDSITNISHDYETQELLNIPSVNLSFIDSEANHIESLVDPDHSLILDKIETINSSSSSLDVSFTQILHAPIARRPDGTEMVPPSSSSKSPSHSASSNILLFKQVYFPRSLTSRGKKDTTSQLKRKLPSSAGSHQQSSQQNQVYQEQFDTKQLYDLLDHLDDDSDPKSHINFAQKLNQLTLSTVMHSDQDSIISTKCSIENLSCINQDDNDDDNTSSLPNLFSPSSSLSTQEKLFYTTLTFNINDPQNIFLYTMTISIVQISSSIMVPYSILTGRRPVLKCSKQTNFKRFRSNQQKHTYPVTAIETTANLKQFQPNDIILKINGQPVWGIATDSIINMLKKCCKQTNNCSLTIARLCSPLLPNLMI